ncbi:peptidase inhibitor 15-A-like [Paramacrobiotus metropolitanus]|uniref:peptidase inhibitor 15-A-like n=1 Tax=Paramacrobiotus metropolitanus TaxID=2943436 RepID=UPI002445F849|nr:peptidase inhibitor 15-A-like [Paramacrobiotus metropolitanus]
MHQLSAPNGKFNLTFSLQLFVQKMTFLATWKTLNGRYLRCIFIIISAAIWQSDGFGARPFGSSSSSSNGVVNTASAEQSLLAFIYSCMGATSNAALGCPCAGNGRRCKDSLSICQNFKCICDSSISTTVGGQCVAIASLTNSETTTSTTTTTTSTTTTPATTTPTTTTTTTTTTTAPAGCPANSDSALPMGFSNTCTGATCTSQTTTPPTPCATGNIAYPVKASPLSNTDILNILNAHNNYRRTVVAKNMQKLAWESCAASNAQTWAASCPTGHDFVTNGVSQANARKVPDYSGGCGQNIAWGYNSWTDAVKGWYDEVKDFTYCSANNVFSKVGHYTQLMWADTAKVGCGYYECPTDITVNGLTLKAPVKTYVCNYCPPGNGGNLNCPWQSADSSTKCSACPTGKKCATGDCLCA